MNIRLRLTFWYTAIFLLILVIFSLAVYVALTRNLMNTVDNHLQREVGEILGNLDFESDGHDDHPSEGDNDHSPATTAIELSYTPEEGVLWRVLDVTGQPLIDPGHFAGAVFTADVTHLSRAQLENAALADGTPIRLYTVPFVIEPHFEGVVQVAESYRHVQEVQNQLIFLLGVGIPLTLLASSAGGWFLAASALAPIDRITRTARQISASDLHQRIELERADDEVGRLADTFDQMLARLEEAFEQQRRFIADASHEMKTPLTILKGDVEVALTRPRSPEYYRETLEMVNSTTDRLIALVQELLLLARADSRHDILHLDTVNLAQLLTDEVARLLPKAIDKNIELHLDAPEMLRLEADAAKLQRLFMNLIDNALKYSNPGDSVTVTAQVVEGQARVTVADTGPGIAAEHLPHLFERFYRVDKARSHAESTGTGSGAGLGLSIAQWLAQTHHGRVEVASRPGQGTVFTVWLPLTPPALPESKD
jgi:heavy metal sensor kinase